MLTLNVYTNVGGVTKALNDHADDIFNKMGNPADRKWLQHIAERLFCSLSDRREGGPLTRRPITVEQAAFEITDDNPAKRKLSNDSTARNQIDRPASPPLVGYGLSSEALMVNVDDLVSTVEHARRDLMAVAQAFQRANLLVFSPASQPLSPETRLDISHESLLRQLDKLRGWREVEDEAAAHYRGIVYNAGDNLRQRGSLLIGPALAAAVEWWNDPRVPNTYGWAQRYSPRTYGVARGYLIESLLAETHQRERDEQEAREKAEAKERELQYARDLAAKSKILVEEQEKLAKEQHQRAVDAEAATARIAFRKRIARITSFLTITCLFFALDQLRRAKVAIEKARNQEGQARKEKNAADEARDKARELQQSAEKQQAISARENADHFWRLAATVRDDKTNLGPVRSSFLFLRGAERLDSIPKTQLTSVDEHQERNLGLAASFTSTPIVRTWIHEGPVNEVRFNNDESRVLTWCGHFTTRWWDVTTPKAN